ncbi:hypothetical protein AX17_001078 [Amanita inopinata Kibby_2008]|nr:hypothetical protein AX17_001078 [Amanita inopinata Kibby_2008]
MAPPLILYRYENSPFSRKIENVLLFRCIPHLRVNVASVLPRPEITELLGITYRRIPILAIGRDVYCDTSLIVAALERHFPPSVDHGTMFPKAKVTGHVDSGIVKALSQFYAETAAFPLAVSLLPWDKLPTSFVQDRGLLSGTPVAPKLFIASRGKALSTLSSHLQLLEEQLNDGRAWLLETEEPGLADISLHFIYTWAQQFPTAKDLISEDTFPHVVKWLTRLTSLLAVKAQQQPAPTLITGDEAAELIASSTYGPLDTIGFNTLEASRLGVQENELVKVSPNDTGKNYPTTGKLIALSRSESVIEVTGTKGTVRCHFPRLNFTIKAATMSRL